MNEDFDDEHAGQGGSYVIGADGRRVLQERAGHTTQQPPAQPVGAAQTEPQTTNKVKGVRNA